MDRFLCISVAFMLASAVVQAKQCSSGGDCPSDDEPKRAVSLLQQKLQMNVFNDGDKAFDLRVANSSAEGVADYQCSDTNRAQYAPMWGGMWGAAHSAELEAKVAADISGSGASCGRASPRCQTSLFQDKVSGPWMPCCEKRQFHEVLRWFNNVVQSHIGDEFWYALVYGTLLGSARAGEMIDYDTDIDIAVPSGSISWLEGLLKEEGAKEDPPYSVSLDSLHGIHAIRLHMSLANTAHIDIWPTEGLDQALVNVGGRAPIPNFQFFPLQQCTFGQRQFPCPNNKEKFLKHWYGDSWQESHPR